MGSNYLGAKHKAEKQGHPVGPQDPNFASDL